MRVLVIFPGSLGDLICCLPALRAIARRHAPVSLELMARGELARLAVGRMGVARGHSIDRPETSLLFTDCGARSSEAQAFFGSFDWIHSFFAGDDVRFRRSLEDVARGRTSFHPFRPVGDGHIAACYLRALGVRPETALTGTLHLAAEERESARRMLLERAGLAPQEFILVLPGSGSPRKNWPLGNFIALGERMAAWAPSLFLLGPAEAELSKTLKSRSLRVLDDLQLGEVAAMAQAARCFVGNDSGVSHLAAAAGAPGVVLFGPTDPKRWAPIGRVTVLRSEPLTGLAVAPVATAIAALIH